MRKRKYLYRLAVSLFFILLLPMVIFIVCFAKYSYDKLEAANTVHSEALMDYYMGQFDQFVQGMKDSTASLLADSKKSTNAFWEVKTEDHYWYYRAINELKDKYGNISASDLGIYFYEKDSIITSKGKLSSDGYFQKLEIKDPDTEELLTAFFEPENYEEFVLTTGGTEHQESGKNVILFGFGAELGRYRERVLVFYKYSEEDIKQIFESAYIEDGLEFSLWDKNNDFTLYLNERSNEKGEDIREILLSQEDDYKENGIWSKESNLHPIVLIGYMNENAPRNMALTFLDNMRVALSVVLLVVLAGYILILYIAYKPIFNLTSKLKHVRGNEFETIGNALDDRKAKIEEQEMLLLDLLINNLLYKAPISKSKMKQLEIEPVSYYTVFLLDNLVLSDAESKKMISSASEKLCERMFVTDLEGENRTVFVVFLKNKETDVLKEWLQKNSIEQAIAEQVLVGGKVVSDIKDIWECFKYCEEELAQKGSVQDADMQKNSSSRDEKRIKLRQDILLYVDAHYRDIDLTQTQMADYFNISVYTLSRIFRNDVGIGFVAYVNAKRVEYAKELLLTTKENVHDIAVKSGFDNDNNFFKVFKANTGMSPTTFRES